ncbi:MAG: hypothetical protein HKN85_12700, partial [Gammaproteobacteria bacterium]|nr:hypothetical protein [Gammaproteobacteria bacterium]
MIIGIMAPAVWVLGSTLFDRVATTGLVVVYAVVLVGSWYCIKQARYIKAAGLAGAVLDIAMIGALPVIWYTALGGSELPLGVTLKTSVTLMAVLFISLNTLAIRPLYPLLVTAGALLVHLILLAGAIADRDSIFTESYLAAYTTEQISTGRVTTQILVAFLVGTILTLLTMRARQMIIESAELQKRNSQLG